MGLGHDDHRSRMPQRVLEGNVTASRLADDRDFSSGGKPGQANHQLECGVLHLAGKVAVDLHADADLAKFRTGPGHGAISKL